MKRLEYLNEDAKVDSMVPVINLKNVILVLMVPVIMKRYPWMTDLDEGQSPTITS